jgi:hypothetical protein
MAKIIHPLGHGRLSPAQSIYISVGRALSVFSFLEHQLCQVFVVAIRNTYSDQAESAYWSITSFEARLRMVSAAVESRHRNSLSLKKEWTELRTKLTTQNTIRNKIAHGTVLTVEFSTKRNPKERAETFFAPYYWGRTSKPILPQRDFDKDITWHDPRPAERLSAQQIDRHKEDFLAHGTLLNEFAEKIRLETRRKIARMARRG